MCFWHIHSENKLGTLTYHHISSSHIGLDSKHIHQDIINLFSVPLAFG